MQPGDTITPGTKPPEPPDNQPPAEVPETLPAEQTPAPAVESVEPPETPKEPDAPESQWQFNNEESPAPENSAPMQHDPVNWTASEYIAHEKSAGWYMLLALAVVAFAAAVYFVTKELVSSVVIVIMGAAFGAFAARKPQELEYSLDNSALHVGGRSYSYAQFKSFTIVDEGPIHSIMLMPLQRFMPPLSVYYGPEDEDKIANALSSYLPYEDRKQDYIDKFMRKVRF